MLQSKFTTSILALSIAAALGSQAFQAFAQSDMQRILDSGKGAGPTKAAEAPRQPAPPVVQMQAPVSIAPAAAAAATAAPVNVPTSAGAPPSIVVQAPGVRSAVGSRVEVQEEKKPPAAKSENLFPKVTSTTDLEALGRLGEDVMLKKLKQELQNGQGGHPAGQTGTGTANANAPSAVKPSDEDPVLLAVYGVDEDLRGDIQFRGTRISVKQGDSIGNGWRVSAFSRGRIVLSHSKQKPREILFGAAAKQPAVAAQAGFGTGMGGGGMMPPPLQMAPPPNRS